MAYVTIPAGDIVAGKPTKEEIFTQIRSNQEQFNSDISALQGTSKIDVMDFTIFGEIQNYTAAAIDSRMPIFKSPLDGTFVSFVVTLLETSTSGTLSFNMDKSVDNGINWVPLLSSDVDLTGTTVGSISGAVTFVDVPSQSFAQNDLIRLRITSTQVGQGGFHVSVYAELS